MSNEYHLAGVASRNVVSESFANSKIFEDDLEKKSTAENKLGNKLRLPPTDFLAGSRLVHGFLLVRPPPLLTDRLLRSGPSTAVRTISIWKIF